MKLKDNEEKIELLGDRVANFENKNENNRVESFKPSFYFGKRSSFSSVPLQHFDDPSSPERQLLDKTLQDVSCFTRDEFKHVSKLGMGGIGKTTALMTVCDRPEIKEFFKDGVYFLEFGENVRKEKVLRQLHECVENFGGTESAQDMKSEASIDGAIEKGARWFKGRTILLLCDDLWPISDVNATLDSSTTL